MMPGQPWWKSGMVDRIELSRQDTGGDDLGELACILRADDGPVWLRA